MNLYSHNIIILLVVSLIGCSHSVDGQLPSKPVFESDKIRVQALPNLSAKVEKTSFLSFETEAIVLASDDEKIYLHILEGDRHTAFSLIAGNTGAHEKIHWGEFRDLFKNTTEQGDEITILGISSDFFVVGRYYGRSLTQVEMRAIFSAIELKKQNNSQTSGQGQK